MGIASERVKQACCMHGVASQRAILFDFLFASEDEAALGAASHLCDVGRDREKQPGRFSHIVLPGCYKRPGSLLVFG